VVADVIKCLLFRRPVAIVRAEREIGASASGCDWWRPVVERAYKPGDGYRWEYAKFCFRSSVLTLVTFVDHLFVLHM